MGEALQFPAATRVVRNWFLLHASGTLTGVYNSAAPLPSRSRLIPVSLDRSDDLALGDLRNAAMRLMVAIVWFAFYRDPIRSQMSEAEIASLDARQDAEAEWKTSLVS